MLLGDTERGHQPEIGSYYRSTLKIRRQGIKIAKLVN